MANFDFSYVGGLKTKEPKEKLSLEEINKRLEALNKKHEEIMALPDEEFISKEVMEQLNEISTEILELIRMMRYV